MNPPITVNQFHMDRVHIGYYFEFIRVYASITTPLEKILKKFEGFHWTQDCDKAFILLKYKLITAPILTYPNWKIEFHVHIDASAVPLGAILA